MSRYSNITQNKRNQFKGALDEFCTFKWNDLDSWDEFGAFIIADKRGDLKASSGPSFTNNYSKPQFESAAGQLQGITFNTKQISFKVGVYWATMEDYRKFLNWLHPYEVADLQFSYDNDYAYFCKLAKIDDVSKYVVGYKGNEIVYYFETNITFETQGEACAHKKFSYSTVNNYSIHNQQNVSYNASELDNDMGELIGNVNSNYKDIFYTPIYCINNNVQSELDTGFKISLFNFILGERKAEMNFKDLSANNIYVWTRQWPISIKCLLKRCYLDLGVFNTTLNTFDVMQNLFTINFKDNVEFDSINDLIMTYDSQQGLVYWGVEDQLTPVSYLTFWDNKKIIQSLIVNKCTLPGSYTANLDYSTLSFRFIIEFELDGTNDKKIEITIKSTSEDKITDTDGSGSYLEDFEPLLQNKGLNKLTGNELSAIDSKIIIQSGANLELTMYDRRQII